MLTERGREREGEHLVDRWREGVIDREHFRCIPLPGTKSFVSEAAAERGRDQILKRL